MRLTFSIVLFVFMAGPAMGGDCYQKLQDGDTMEKVIELCGEPTHRKDMGSDMKVRGEGAGQAKMLTIEHSRTETLWVYENDREAYLRFVNGRLVEKETKSEE